MRACVDRRREHVNITGGCHCGAIRYQVEGELIVHALCHCTDCRRHAGAPMVGWTMYAEDALKVTKGTAQGLPVLRTWPAAVLRRLRHGALLHQCECAARHHRYSERRPTTIPMPFRRWCISRPPSGLRWMERAARTAQLRALSAADIARCKDRRSAVEAGMSETDDPAIQPRVAAQVATAYGWRSIRVDGSGEQSLRRDRFSL